jgi:hypothetical protein
MNEERHRIKIHTAIAMVTLAILFDLLQLLLIAVPLVGAVMSSFVSFVPPFLFFLWFKLVGVTYLDRGMQKVAASAFGMLIEYLPLVNALPGWTISVILTILIVRREDKKYNREVALALS